MSRRKPDGPYHFDTGRMHAIRLGYERAILDQLPDEACEAFAGMANPTRARPKPESLDPTGSEALSPAV